MNAAVSQVTPNQRPTPPSSGRPKAGFAHFGPPLISNVGPHEQHVSPHRCSARLAGRSAPFGSAAVRVWQPAEFSTPCNRCLFGLGRWPGSDLCVMGPKGRPGTREVAQRCSCLHRRLVPGLFPGGVPLPLRHTRGKGWRSRSTEVHLSMPRFRNSLAGSSCSLQSCLLGVK